MKNLQKGFVVPLLLVIIVVLVVGGGVYFYSKNIQTHEVSQTPKTIADNNTESVTTTSSSLKTSDWQLYKDIKFGLSFKYPKDWAVTSHGGVTAMKVDARLSIQNKNITKYLDIDFDDKPTNSFTVSKNLISTAPISIAGYTAETYAVPEFAIGKNNTPIPTGNKTIIYRIKLGKYSGYDVTISMSTSANGASLKVSDDIMQVIKSISIDKNILEKTLSAVHSEQGAGIDDSVKFSLTNARTEAEVYWDKSESYAGFCAQNETIKNVKISYPKANIICKDSQYAYALSYAMINGFWCIDSQGYIGNAKSLNIQTQCIK
jgi:hypothetical protein